MRESALRRADWPARRGRIFQADRSEPNLLSGKAREEGRVGRHIRRANFQIAERGGRVEDDGCLRSSNASNQSSIWVDFFVKLQNGSNAALS